MKGMSHILPLHPAAQSGNTITNRKGDGRFLRVGPFINTAMVVRSLGCDPEPVFKSQDFTLDQFTHPDVKLPYLRISHLLDACAEATGCEHFGLLLGQSASASHLGLAGFMMRSAPTVEVALESLVAHFDLHDGGGRPTVIKTSEVTFLGYTVEQAGTAAVHHIYDMSIAIACNIMRALCGKSWCPTEVMLSRRKPNDTEPYRRFFNAPVQFNAELSAIAFRSRCLQQPVASADPLLFDHFEQAASSQHRLQDQDFAENLATELRNGLLQRHCSARSIASKLSLHERTLHRRLSAAGTSFRQELDKVRHVLSLQLLEGTSMSVAQIAESMGYGSSSAFIRAFSRWTGSSPTKHRHAKNRV